MPAKQSESKTMTMNEYAVKSIGSITVLVACTFSYATGKQENLPLDAIEVCGIDQETLEILGNAALLSELKDADGDVENGELIDREDLPA